MKLISNWKTVLTRAASVWFVLAGLVALLGFFFATISPEMTRCSPVYFAVASAVFQTLAIPARIVLQAGLADLREFRRSQAGAMRNRSLGIIAGGGIALSTALAFIGGWEGLRQEAYRDVVGVWTVCYGKTQQVAPGDRYSKAECDQILAAEILSYEAALDQCLTATVPLGMQEIHQLKYRVAGRLGHPRHSFGKGKKAPPGSAGTFSSQRRCPDPNGRR